MTPREKQIKKWTDHAKRLVEESKKKYSNCQPRTEGKNMETFDRAARQNARMPTTRLVMLLERLLERAHRR